MEVGVADLQVVASVSCIHIAMLELRQEIQVANSEWPMRGNEFDYHLTVAHCTHGLCLQTHTGTFIKHEALRSQPTSFLNMCETFGKNYLTIHPLVAQVGQSVHSQLACSPCTVMAVTT